MLSMVVVQALTASLVRRVHDAVQVWPLPGGQAAARAGAVGRQQPGRDAPGAVWQRWAAGVCRAEVRGRGVMKAWAAHRDGVVHGRRSWGWRFAGRRCQEHSCLTAGCGVCAPGARVCFCLLVLLLLRALASRPAVKELAWGLAFVHVALSARAIRTLERIGALRRCPIMIDSLRVRPT